MKTDLKKEKLLVVLHGSPKKTANTWEAFRKYLAKILALPEEDVVICYLQFGTPSVEAALREAMAEGVTRVIVHPLFLSSGVHVRQDLPNIIDSVKRDYEKVEVIITKPLGQHEKLAEIVKERIEEVKDYTPQSIEAESFRLIEAEYDLKNFPEKEREIVKRVVHATADPDYVETMVIHPKAIEIGLKNLREGKKILVDVEMVKAGISKALFPPDKVICYLNQVEEEGVGTRSERAIELALRKERDFGIVAIGNSPTALLKTIEVLPGLSLKEVLVIGMPVGFVKALSAKMLLLNQSFPYITNLSRKGGSPPVCAVVNALLRMI